MTIGFELYISCSKHQDQRLKVTYINMTAGMIIADVEPCQQCSAEAAAERKAA